LSHQLPQKSCDLSAARAKDLSHKLQVQNCGSQDQNCAYIQINVNDP